MYKLKQGFTIAELLLVIVIIGVISAMGANITKKSTSRAYNLFWNNGFTTLNNVICEIEYLNSKTSESDSNKMQYETFTTADWLDAINKMYNGNKAETPADNIVRTNNGTKYLIESAGSDAIMITMSVPAPKSRNGSEATAKIFFDPTGSNMLIPVSGGDVNLSQRMDLLPVIIDDGTQERVMQKYNGSDSAEYKKSDTVTFQKAYCRTKGAPTGTTATYFNCTDADGSNLVPETLNKGVLRFPPLKG